MTEVRKATILIKGDDGAWTPVGGGRMQRLTLNSDVIPVASAPKRRSITGTLSEQIDDDWAWWAIQRALQRYRQ